MTTYANPRIKARATTFARAAVRLEFRARDARALDQGTFADRRPNQVVRTCAPPAIAGEAVLDARPTSNQIVKPPERRPSITQDKLAQIATRIRARIRRTTEDIIKTGHDLIQVKAGLDHGQFHEWIETECGMTDRAARNYMQAARWAEGKPETISDLPPTTIYALASPSTAKEIQDRVVADLEAGKKIDMHEVSRLIKMARTERQLEHRVDLQKQDCNRRRSEKYQRQREQEKTEHEARQKQAKEAVQEACSILLKLDTSDLDRLVELLDTAKNIGFGGLGSLPEALAHAMRCAEA